MTDLLMGGLKTRPQHPDYHQLALVGKERVRMNGGCHHGIAIGYKGCSGSQLPSQSQWNKIVHFEKAVI